MIKPLLTSLLLLSIGVFSQEKSSHKLDNQAAATVKSINLETNETKKDTAMLINHREATLIDSLWLKSLYNSPLNDDFQYVNPDENISDTIYNELETAVLKERLSHLNSTTPFNVEYNASLEKIIKHYLKTRKNTLGDLMGKAAYYFPMFEEHLDKYNLPLEIKYLAIVESALRPRARSRVGASGLWQFMYYTGKQFNLNVSSYVDERHDPIRATEAACKYLSNLYSIFNDWDLALAAYTSGSGKVSKANRSYGGCSN